MFSNRTRGFISDVDIRVTPHLVTNSLITEPDLFTLVLLKHKGDIRLNFETITVSGTYLLFLCPNEVLEVSGYEHLTTIGFPERPDLRNTEGFIHAYGNIDKFFPIPEAFYETIEQSIYRIKEFSEKRPLQWDEKAISILKDIFRLSLTYTGKLRSSEHSIIYDFISLVHEHYTMHHQMSYYAKLLKTPSKSITEKFNALGVMNPHSYIKQRIVTEAKRQLLYTHKNVKTICFDIGFNDPAYFARFFKKNTGMTTKEFRSNYKKNNYAS